MRHKNEKITPDEDLSEEQRRQLNDFVKLQEDGWL